MLEFHEPTFFDTRNYQNPDASVPPGIDPFENADESILGWADSVRARLKAKREAKNNKLNRDRNIQDLPVIETSPSLPTDESLPVIEAIEAVSIEGSVQSVGRDRDLPVIEDRKIDTPQAISKQPKSKNSGCIGTYKKGELEYYRYSYRVDGKVRHKHIGSTSCKYSKQMVKNIMSWIDADAPSRWIVAHFLGGQSYPEKQQDCDDAYEKILIREKGAEKAREILKNLGQTPKIC
jgi:hypothetical protein